MEQINPLGDKTAQFAIIMDTINKGRLLLFASRLPNIRRQVEPVAAGAAADFHDRNSNRKGENKFHDFKSPEHQRRDGPLATRERQGLVTALVLHDKAVTVHLLELTFLYVLPMNHFFILLYPFRMHDNTSFSFKKINNSQKQQKKR